MRSAEEAPPLYQRRSTLKVASLTSQASSLTHRDGELEAVTNFERMRSSDFREYAKTHTDVLHDGSRLGPESMKHESWKGSDIIPPIGLHIAFFVLLILLVAAAVGVSVGFTLTPSGGMWGWISGSIILAASGLLFLTALIAYMAAYSSSLKTERIQCCVQRLGFRTNISANLICRYIMTCCFNGKCHIFGLSTRTWDGHAPCVCAAARNVDAAFNAACDADSRMRSHERRGD